MQKRGGGIGQRLLGFIDLRAPELPAAKPASPRLRFAHAKVVRSFPESGAVVPETVGKVEVWYSDAIANAFVALAVINAAGERVDRLLQQIRPRRNKAVLPFAEGSLMVEPS